MKNNKCAITILLMLAWLVQSCGSENSPPIVEVPPIVEEPAIEEPPVEDPTAFELAMAKCNNPWGEDGVVFAENADLLNDALLQPCYRVSGIIDGLEHDNIELALNDNEIIAQSNSGSFEFVTPLLANDNFTVSKKNSPQSHQCRLINNTATINDSNVGDVIVFCSVVPKPCDKTSHTVTDNKDLSGNNIVGIEAVVEDIECGNDPWRIAANERIENARKTTGQLLFVDKYGDPITTIKVNLKLKNHKFSFGSVVQAKQLTSTAKRVGSTNEIEGDFYKKTYLDFGMNKAGFGLALKYKQHNNYEHLVPDMLAWFKAHDIPVRGHTLMWPKWGNMETTISAADASSMGPNGITPGKPEDLPADELKIYVDEVITRWANKWDVAEWDVFNEPRGHHDVQDILGFQEEANWFKLAKEHVQNSATLFLNENRVISDPSEILISDNMIAFRETAESILAEEGPLEALGFQSRFGSMLSAETIYQRLSYFDDLNLPISATEFELKDNLITAEIDRAIMTERVMTVYFSKANVTDIIAWTFMKNPNREDARHIIDLEGNVNLRGKAWLYLVKKHWNTDISTWLDRQGQTTLTGFKGDYTATLLFENGAEQQVDFRWDDGLTEQTIQLDNYASEAN